MKKILFPTDFSQAADHAFVYALKMADAVGASITTLHIFTQPKLQASHLPNTMDEIIKSMEMEEFEEYKSNLSKLRQLAKSSGLEHITIKNLQERGEDVVRHIIQTAKKEGVDYIILGTKGAGWMKEIFFGSVAGELLENAHCPVLAIPRDAVFDGKIDKIAITTNFKEEEVRAINMVLEFADTFGAKVYCINVDLSHATDVNQFMEQFKLRFRDVPNLEFITIDGMIIEQDLSDFVEQKEIDILAMVTHKRNFFQELFNYSHAKKMSYHSRVPVLSIQAHLLT